MSDTKLTGKNASLLVGPEPSGAPKANAAAPIIAQVQREFGVHPLKQMREIVAGRLSARKIGSNEYYDLRLFDPDRSKDEKSAFLGQGATNVMNDAMNPNQLVPMRYLVNNKLLYTELLAKLGIQTTTTQALVSKSIYAGEVTTLRDASAIKDFLLGAAKYPLFGKPFDGSLSIGSVRIKALEGGRLELTNGRSLDIEDFANEVIQRYPNGYLVQSALQSHAKIAEIAGQATACIRIVTVNDGEEIRPLYAVWKLPAPQAMSDNFWQKGSLLALVDIDTGKVRSCRRGTGMETEWLSQHPESGTDLTGHILPMWSETLDLACNAHRVFPEFGVCGFDIAVTPESPVIVECNDNPAHMLYQLASQRGVRSDDLSPAWDKVIVRQRKRLAQFKQAQKENLQRRGVRARQH